MKKQLTAKNPLVGMTIIQRFIDGDRFYKITPSNIAALAIPKLKEQFKDKPIELVEGKNGWLKISRVGECEELNEQAKKVMEKKGEPTEVDENYILNKEAEMLKSQGFQVEVTDLE